MSLIDCRSGLSPSQIQNINFLTKSWCYNSCFAVFMKLIDQLSFPRQIGFAMYFSTWLSFKNIFCLTEEWYLISWDLLCCVGSQSLMLADSVSTLLLVEQRKTQRRGTRERKIQPSESFRNKSTVQQHSNLNKSSTGLYRQPWKTRPLTYFQ